MKQVRLWLSIITSIILIVSWGIIGVKIFDGNYNFAVEAYIALGSLIVLVVCGISKVFTDKCPHCGKVRSSTGKYCPHCGKEIEN